MCVLALKRVAILLKILNMKNILYLVFSLMVLVSCKARTAITTKPSETISSNKVFFDAINKKDNFESIKINSRIDAETGKFIPTIDGTFYIENNQKIWINFQVFVNVARALVTPSGIKAYEKINKTYIDSNFTYINNLLKVNFIDYNSLQNLLMGKTFIPVSEKDYLLLQNTQGYLLTSIKNQIFEIDGKTSEYKISLEYTPELDLKKVNLENVNSNNSLEINYDNYEILGSQKLPKNVKIIIKGKKTDQILIENTKFEFLKMETPFSIPANYTKTEINNA